MEINTRKHFLFFLNFYETHVWKQWNFMTTILWFRGKKYSSSVYSSNNRWFLISLLCEGWKFICAVKVTHVSYLYTFILRNNNALLLYIANYIKNNQLFSIKQILFIQSHICYISVFDLVFYNTYHFIKPHNWILSIRRPTYIGAQHQRT